MQDSITAIIAEVDFTDHLYETERRLAILERKVKLASEQKRLSPELYLTYGEVLLEAGKSQEAIDVFEFLMERLPQNREVMEQTKGFHELLALGYLRRGEQQNCIAKHTPVSCIFPIQPEAVHTLPESSQEAIKKHPCRLYLNQQDGTFRDVAPALGLATTAYVKGVNAGDVNNDGRPDLYLSILTGSNQLFLNEGGSSAEQWQFREVAASAGVTKPKESFPTWFFDYDNDGDEDLFVINFDIYLLKQQAWETAADYLNLPVRSAYSCLYRNDGNGRFTDVTKEMGLDRILAAMGCNYGDLDNDGFPDFYLGTGAPDFRSVVPNRMFRNANGKAFQDVTYAGGFGHIQKGHGISFADVNNDGDQDIYAVMGGSVSGDLFQNAFFENPGNDNNWVTLRLEGTTANRSAIGARIRLDITTDDDERTIYHTVNSGASFGANSLQAEIGLGARVQEVQLAINWPDGLNQWKTYGVIPFDQILSIKQGSTKIQSVDVKSFAFAQAQGGNEHHNH